MDNPRGCPWPHNLAGSEGFSEERPSEPELKAVLILKLPISDSFFDHSLHDRRPDS